MGDLISRKALLEILNAKSDMAIATPAQMIYANAAKIVELLPAVDAVPVRHGRWRHLGGDEWRCTICGEVIHTEDRWERPSGKYCRECGTRMDGGD